MSNFQDIAKMSTDLQNAIIEQQAKSALTSAIGGSLTTVDIPTCPIVSSLDIPECYETEKTDFKRLEERKKQFERAFKELNNTAKTTSEALNNFNRLIRSIKPKFSDSFKRKLNAKNRENG